MVAINVMDVIAIAIVIVLVAKDVLPKQGIYIVNGAILIAFGLIPLLTYYGIFAFDIYSYAVAKYIILFVVIVAGQELFKEGIKEGELTLRIPSIILGMAIIVITAIPQLFNFGAISFILPSYSPIIDFILYLASGILILIGLTKVKD